MNTLGKKHWFTAPKEIDFSGENVFKYLFADTVSSQEEDSYDCAAPRAPVEARLHLPALPSDWKSLLKGCRAEEDPRNKTDTANTPPPSGEAPQAHSAVPATPESAPEDGAEAEKQHCPCDDGNGDSFENHAAREFKEWAWVTIWDENWWKASRWSRTRDIFGGVLPKESEVRRRFCTALQEFRDGNEEGRGNRCGCRCLCVCSSLPRHITVVSETQKEAPGRIEYKIEIAELRDHGTAPAGGI